MMTEVIKKQIWQTKEGLPGDTAGIQVQIDEVYLDQNGKLEYVDYTFMRDIDRFSPTRYGSTAERFLREFELVTSPVDESLFKKGDKVLHKVTKNKYTVDEVRANGRLTFDGWQDIGDFDADAFDLVEEITAADVNRASAAAAAETWGGSDEVAAPLDLSKVQAGDTVTVSVLDPDIQPEPYTVSGRVYGPGNGFLAVGMTTLRHNGEWDGRATLTAHQPAPEPEPEWKPGTVAHVETTEFSGRASLQEGGDVWRSLDGFYSIRATSAPMPAARPLVVIDRASLNLEELADVFEEADEQASMSWSDYDRLAAINALLDKLEEISNG